MKNNTAALASPLALFILSMRSLLVMGYEDVPVGGETDRTRFETTLDGQHFCYHQQQSIQLCEVTADSRCLHK